jgi:hypothetical protein
MATFEVPERSFEDIEVAKPLPNATYGLRLSKPAYIQRNKNENGYNCILEMEVFGEPDDTHNGRVFTVYMSMPSSETDDFNRKTKRGQTIADFKMDMITKNVAALGGEVEGHNFTIPDTAMAKAAIIQQPNPENIEDIWNSISGSLMPYDG